MLLYILTERMMVILLHLIKWIQKGEYFSSQNRHCGFCISLTDGNIVSVPPLIFQMDVTDDEKTPFLMFFLSNFIVMQYG